MTAVHGEIEPSPFVRSDGMLYSPHGDQDDIDTDIDTDTECRFAGNVSRQPAAYGSHARATERGQVSFPKGIANTSAAPHGIVSIST